MFKKNDIIEIYERDASGWWLGRLNGFVGWVPGDYLVLLEENFFEEVEDHDEEKVKFRGNFVLMSFRK
jgi:hypothetical protein